MLDLTPQTSGDYYTIELPEDYDEPFDGRSFDFAFAEPSPDGHPVHRVAPGSALFEWLIKQLGKQQPVSAQPATQPQNVYELSPLLFAPYQVDDGKMHLAGCTLEERPILRLTYISDDAHPSLSHVYVHADGSIVSQELVDQLRLHVLVPQPPGLAKLRESQRKVMEHAAQQHASQRTQRLVLRTVIWCRFAEGKLVFVIGSQSVELSFGDWAQHLADQIARPPAYHCGLTGKSSYHLAATDNEQITTAESIGVCEESGTRALVTDLDKCEVTGKTVLKSQLQTCPVSETKVLPSAMVECSMCDQLVAPTALRAGVCGACQTVAPASKSDPRMARVLGEFPNLDRFGKWRLSETQTCYILVAIALLERILIVVDKQSLEVRHLASSGRFRTQWRELQSLRRDELLK